MISKHNVDRVVFNGDLFNSVQNLSGPFFNLAFSGMYNLKVPIDIIDGNHDKYDTVYKVLEPFKIFARVHSEPVSYFDNTLQMKVAMIPFQRNLEDALTAIDNCTKEEIPTLVFIHQGLAGHCRDPLAIPKSAYDKPHIKKVFGGHYHFKFTDGFPGREELIVYPGSVVSLHFDDNLQSKYCVIYDTKTDELIWEENPNTAYFISLKQSQIAENRDKLESLAPVSYLRVILDDDTTRLPMSFLSKFKGYTTAKDKSEPILYSTDDAAYVDTEKAFNYTEFSTSLNMSEDNMTFDLTYDQFNELVLKSNADASLLKATDAATLSIVMARAFEFGNA
jgi:DNA repair exonuclease SbcCD nuclease subunit